MVASYIFSPLTAVSGRVLAGDQHCSEFGSEILKQEKTIDLVFSHVHRDQTFLWKSICRRAVLNKEIPTGGVTFERASEFLQYLTMIKVSSDVKVRYPPRVALAHLQ